MGIANGLRRLSGFCVVDYKNHLISSLSRAVLLLGLLTMLPEAALAQHPGCYYYPPGQCPAPPPLTATPVISEVPSLDGSYQVSISNGDTYSWTLWNTGQTGNTISVSGQATGTYSYNAKRCINTGSGTKCSTSWSPSATTHVLRAPDSPSFTNTTASTCATTLTVNWVPGSGGYPTTSPTATKRYTLEESLDGGIVWSNSSVPALPADSTAVTWGPRNVAELGNYRYRVKSRYQWNGYTSSWSGWTTAANFQMPQCPPAQPASPSLSQPNPNTSTEVSISWGSVGTVLHYSVERSPDNSNWISVCTVSGTSCSDDSATLTRGVTYYYRVRANKSTVSSPWSSASSITILFAQPSAPSTPAFSNVAPYDYDLSWSGGGNGNTGTITYKLWEKIGSNDWSSSPVYTGTGITWSPTTSRTPTTVYQYKVAACNNNSPQQCTESAVNSISFPGTPGAITFNGIGNSGRDYTLNWTAASGTVTTYKLERSINGGSWAQVLDQNVLLSGIVNATAGTDYQYRVRACNSLACGTFTAAKAYWVPQTPTNLTGSANPATPSMSLSWTGHASTHHYELQQSTNGGTTWGSVISVTGTSHNPAGVTNGVDYTYRVRACNLENACSPFITPVTIRLPYATPGVPAAPTISVNSTAGTLSASWTAVSGVVSTYKVEQRIGTGGAWTVVQESSVLSYAPSNLTGGLTYYLRVAACNVDGCSSFGTAASAYLPKATPPLPDLSTGGFIGVINGMPTYSGGYSGQYTLAWSTTGGIVETFNVEEQEPGGAWQAASLAAISCSTGNCVYDKPPNQSGAILVYRYRARACNSDNCSAWKEIAVQVNFYQLPGVPATLTVSQGPTTVGAYTLRWTRPAGTDVVDYYYLDNVDTPTNPDFAAIPHDPNQPHFERAFTGGVSGQTYHYRVRACFQDDNGCDVYTAPLAVYIPYPAPDQTGAINHSSLNASTGSYTLNWSAPTGQVDYYELERQISAAQWTQVVSTALINHSITGQPNGETRSYRVRACNNDNCGSYSEEHAVYVPHLQPGVPTGLTQQAPDATGQSFALSWTAPSTGGLVQNYEIQRSIDAGANWQATGSTASLSLILTGLSNGTNYQYRVRACNVDACGSYSAALAVYLPYAAPGTPGAITHNPGENNPAAGAFTVHWTAPATIDSTVAPLSYYQLEYSANGGSTWQAAPTGGAVPGRIDVSNPVPSSAASATLGGFAAGAAYSMRARACNADACGAYTAAYQVYLPRPAPGAPAWLPTSPSTQDYQERRFTVQWTAPTAGIVHHYQLEAYAGLLNGVDNWVTVAITPALSYTFTDRAYGETYRYRVHACSEAQSSPAHCSTWVISADVRLKYPTPKTPGGIAVGEIDQANGNYNLSWNGVLGWAPAYRYELQENPNNAGWQSLSTTLLDPVHEFAITGRAAGTYTYRVRACNPLPDNDCSGWSPAASATILPTPSAPTGLSVDNLNGNSCAVNVDWTPPTGGLGAYHYELAVQINGGDWTSLAWTTGTSHNMVVHHDDSGDPHIFRVRARTLNNGQYSLWGAWRTGGTVTTSCAYSTSGYQMNVSAPKFSKTGQYGVGMQYTGTWAPGLRTEYEASADGGANWSRISTANQLNGGTSYDALNARPTGHYQYRGAVCTHDIGTGYDPDPTQCGATVNGGGFNTVTVFTTVLRDPGSVGTLRIAGLPNPIDGAYITSNGQVTLDWSAAPNAPAPATRSYEIQYKPDHLTSEDDWRVWAVQSTVDLQLTLPEFGVAYDFRVRGCAHLDDYIHCGAWSPLDYPVKQTMGPPRFAVNSYPADGELVIYDKRVPLQWLPPFGMAEGGIDHYEVSIRSLYTDSNGVVHAIGPEVLSTPAPDTIGSTNSNPKVQQATVEVEQGGQKEFLIRACGTSSPISCGAALTFAITVVVPPDPPAVPSGLSGQPDPDPSSDPFNGALSGEFAVQPSGAATYSLPIIVPPGTAGMQPKISLDYSSQSGNGIAGYGWSVGGLSGIQRCNKTEAQDGESHAVDYSADDAYCLDGQRLFEIGVDQYRTEKNDFRRITRIPSGGACGAWFEVKTQSGGTLEYGKATNTCILNTELQSPLQWALNKSTDVMGNYIVYKYEQNTFNGFKSSTIDRIEYTGHQGGAPYTAVEFDYELRPDPMDRYQAGVGIGLQQRLKEIRTAAGEYRLVYIEDSDPASGSRLESVEYCVSGTPEQCMGKLNFTWHTDSPGWSKLPASWNPPHPFTVFEANPNARIVDQGARLIDLDADGLPDLVYAGTTQKTYRNTGSGWQSWNVANLPSGLKFVGDRDIGNEEQSYIVQIDKGLRFVDRTGDGKPELLDNDGKTYQLTSTGWNEWLGAHELPYVDGEGKDQGIRFADLNGDGQAELVRGYNNEREVRYRGDNAWDGWTQSGASFPANFVQLFQGEHRTKGSELVDVNGDGLIDMMSVIFGTFPNADLNYGAWLNDGNGGWWGYGDYLAEIFVSPSEYDNPYDPNDDTIFKGDDIGMRLLDINADGLPDLLRANARYQHAYMNTGSDWADAITVLPSDFRFLNEEGRGTDMRMADVNVDGFPDILMRGKAWMNPAGGWQAGAGTTWRQHDAYGLPRDPGEGASSYLMDIDGDGHVDMITTGGVWRSHASRYQITGFTDKLGNTTKIKYKALTDKNLNGRSRPIYTFSTSFLDSNRWEMLLPMQVVDRVIVNDGIGGELTTEYAYKGLIIDKGRGVQGFEQMTAYKPDGTVVTTDYATRFPYSGQALEVEIRYGENGPVLNHSTFEYCYAVTTAQAAGPEAAGFASVAPGTSCAPYNDHLRSDESIFVYAKRSTETKNQLSDNLSAVVATVEVVTENTYGRYGYPTHSTVTTTGDGNTYRIETVHEYNSTVADAHWKGLMSQTTVTETVNGMPDGNSVRTTQYFYTSIGQLEREVTEPNAASPVTQSVAYAYDAFGNRVETTVCEGSVCAADPNASNASSPGRSATTVYDAQGRFPITSINALDQSETREYQHPLGLQTKLIGPNGLVTTWAYDKLGRKISETTDFGTTTFDYIKADGGYVPGAEYFVQTNPPGAAPSRVYYDGKGRKRRTLAQSMHGEYIAADIEYDRFGRVRHESQPYFVYATTAGDAYWTEYEYDGLGRAQQTQVPLGDIDDDGAPDGMAVSSIHYDGFETSITDAKGRRTLTEVDALGRDVRKVDDLDGKNISIAYIYDSKGNLLTTTIDGNTATTVSIEYDLRGRKVSMNDPDMGHWEYRYNGYGELIGQTDAKGQVTEIEYDKLGRMVKRIDDATDSAETSNWVYDTAEGAGIGKLHIECHATGAADGCLDSDVDSRKTYSYTARGQLAGTEYDVDTHGWEQSFVVSQTYDAFGRVLQIHYPQVGGSNKVVENVYSPFGGLWYVLDVSDPAEEAVYWIADVVDARGKVIQQTLRNQNIINNSTNAATGWLQKVESWDKDLNMIQQTRYAFDAVGNVESRERFRPWVVHPDGSFEAGQNEQVIESFTYDSLDRLLSATVSRNGVLESSNSYDYDSLGNFDYKDADTPINQYAYNSCNAGPHAVCSAKGSSFAYDANGNMIESTGAKARTVAYSSFNKPVQISENGAVVDFVYGADRARVFKQAVKSDGSTELTWYVGLGAEGAPIYEQTAVVSGGLIKREHLHFIYAGGHHGGQAFAVHVQQEEDYTNPAQPDLILEGHTEYYHRDHLGSVIAITGNKGDVAETRLLSFDPWGKRRNENWSEGSPGPGMDATDQYTPTGMRGNLAYTGHEAIAEVGLIHMNGRVYDPELGVFTSADPHIQMPMVSQSYHRYSYVQNNPLRYTDPSGYFLDKVVKLGLFLTLGPIGGAIAWQAEKAIMQAMPPKLAQMISMGLNFIPGCQGWCSMAFNASYAMHNGASDSDILFNAAVSYVSGQLGAAAGGGISGGVLSGAFSGMANAARYGGDVGRAMVQGAARGAAQAAIVMGIQRMANGTMQPETPTQPEVPVDPQGAQGPVQSGNAEPQSTPNQEAPAPAITGELRLVADRATGTLQLVDGSGRVIETYLVGNNTTNPQGNPNVQGSNGPAPAGTFPVQDAINTTGDPRFGSAFFPIGAVGPNGERMDIARQRGIGLHAGRAGPQSRTHGCLRVSEATIQSLVQYNNANRITSITIR